MNKITDARSYLQKSILDTTLIKADAESSEIFSPAGTRHSWMFDFRLAFSHKKFLTEVSALFWEKFDRTHLWQIGGLETASLPLITALTLTGDETTGFYIRKSRKKKAQLRQIEGDLKDEGEIILVDDLINTGSSFLKQIKVLKEERGLSVKAIFVIVQFYDDSFYTAITEQGIKIYSLFHISELNAAPFKKTLKKMVDTPEVWVRTSDNPHLLEQGVKNIPALYKDKVYVTTDNGCIYAYDQRTGVQEWMKKLLLKKNTAYSTFTSMRIAHARVYITTYNGVLIVLTDAGKPCYRKILHNIFTTPLFVLNTSLVYGASAGRGEKTKSICIYDTEKQAVTTQHQHEARISKNIAVDAKNKSFYYADEENVITGCSESGNILWQTKLTGVNMSGVTLVTADMLLVINTDGESILLSAQTGIEQKKFTLPAFHADMPICIDTKLYGATLSREIYCYDIETHTYDWQYETKGRIYSTPTLYKGYVYVGDNNGEVHVLNMITGKKVYRRILPERVANPILVTNDLFFVSTFANQLYAFENTPTG